MREILFKAKRKDNGKWVEGYYYKMSETTYCFKEDYERMDNIEIADLPEGVESRNFESMEI